MSVNQARSPYVRIGKTQEDYTNIDQRNVHIWASESTRSHNVYLVAGFHNQMIGQPVRWDFVFKWFEMLLAAPLIQSGTYYTQASWVVLPWHDPTQETLPTGQLRLPHQYDEQHFNNWVTYQEQHGFLFTSTSTSPCEPGHYVLVGEFRGMTVLGQASRNFVAQEPQFDSSTQCLRTRPLSVGFTYNRTSQASPQPVKQRKTRSNTTRQLVRLRDMWCRVTGSQAVDRARGLDFTGLEVAHIFPLAAADPTATLFVMPEHRKEAAQRISTRELADHPSNAILLRGDLHRYYDTYQFAVYPDSSASDHDQRKLQVCTFEKDLPTSLEQLPQELLPANGTQPTLLTEAGHMRFEEASDWLLLEHFRTALLWHVAGQGRQ